MSGAFIPVSEDAGMIEAASIGALSLDKLEAWTSVCSVGIDMVAVPGNTSAETISAIIADEMAIGVMHTARRRQVRVPDDLSIVGVDDIRYAGFVDPPLTTVAQPMRDMGEYAVRVLLGILHGDEKPPECVRLPHTLVVRSSTAPPSRWS